jgi:tetratricopeptide (TPR) repeat protein
MTYLVILALVIVCWFLFEMRGILAAILAEARAGVGDYEGALRRLRWASLGQPNVTSLHKQALILTVAGRPAEAEQCYLRAFALLTSESKYPRERLHAGLGIALMDQGRFGEAEGSFHAAVETGDVTGTARDGLAEMRLMQGAEFEHALAWTVEAIEQAKQRGNGRCPGMRYANQAWALALLGRTEAANAAIAEALNQPELRVFGTASLHWRLGMALLATHQPDAAREHFQIGHDADPHGKFGRRCEEHLRGAA